MKQRGGNGIGNGTAAAAREGTVVIVMNDGDDFEYSDVPLTPTPTTTTTTTSTSSSSSSFHCENTSTATYASTPTPPTVTTFVNANGDIDYRPTTQYHHYGGNDSNNGMMTMATIATMMMTPGDGDGDGVGVGVGVGDGVGEKGGGALRGESDIDRQKRQHTSCTVGAWDPVMIVAQIVFVQAAFYAFLVPTMFALSLVLLPSSYQARTAVVLSEMESAPLSGLGGQLMAAGYAAAAAGGGLHSARAEDDHLLSGGDSDPAGSASSYSSLDGDSSFSSSASTSRSSWEDVERHGTVAVNMVFSPHYIRLNTLSGVVATLSFLINSVASAFCLMYAVGNQRKCLDFSCTMQGIHMVACVLISGVIPLCCPLWWILNVICVIITCSLGEYLCIQKELRDIPRGLLTQPTRLIAL
ncbi:protein SYS1 [Pelomyxa schiedti]|nr:protein SYS1 [Pelomyxa schiedti]